MSHAVLRGEATAAQRHLDALLAAAALSTGAPHPERLNLPQLLFHALNSRRDHLFMIDGSTGEKVTNVEVLREAVRLAQALRARDTSGSTCIISLRNDRHMCAVYYGTLFAGLVPFMLDPTATERELEHFIQLVTPALVFCEADKRAAAAAAAAAADDPILISTKHHTYDQYIAGHIEDLDVFKVTDAAAEEWCLMLPTSGSTGLPKATILTHQGLIAQIPSVWTSHTQFPKPTRMSMVVSTLQWNTHTIVLTACPTYEVPILMNPENTPANAVNMLETYKPTWTLFSPPFAAKVSAIASPAKLSSLETLVLAGSAPSANIIATLKTYLTETAHLANCCGMTEAQGFTCLPTTDSPVESVGKLINILDYKMVDDDGEPVHKNVNGELYLRSPFCLFKGYYRNEAADRECLTADGWLKTGDVFREDDHGNMFYVERKKFWFKHLNFHVSPEEVEAIINKVPGVQWSVVSGNDAGPMATIVRRCGSLVSRQQINDAVNATLSEYKRLHGGIAFVEALPLLKNGKLDRKACGQLAQKLYEAGQHTD